MPISIDQIKRRTNEKTYKLGLEIYRDDSKPIIEPSLRGDQILGYYQGSDISPYQIEVTLDDDTITSTSCTCGYKRNDDCKHIIALLITYMHEPQLFKRLGVAEDPLFQLSKEELIALAKRMVNHYPDLQSMIDEPDTKTSKGGALDIEPHRQKLHDVLHHDVRSRHAADAVYDLIELAQYYSSQQDWRDASAIYRMILIETLNPKHTAFDDEGKLVRALAVVVDELSICLQHPSINQAEHERRLIFNALMDAYIWETQTRWEGLTDHIPETVLAFAHPADLTELHDRLEPLHKQAKVLGQLQSASSFSNFLLHIDALNTDPDAIMHYLGKQGLYTLQFHKYLQMGRMKEVANVVRLHMTDPEELVMALNVLHEQGHVDDALALAEGAIRKQFDDTVAGWLIQQYRTAENYDLALKLQRQRMAQSPSLGHYIQLKDLAGILGQWDEICPRILKWLDENGHHEVLTEIHLEEKAWEEAWASLAKAKLSDWRLSELAFDVAEQSRFALPDKAIPVYLERVQANIQAKTRKNYQVAVELLLEMRRLYDRLGDASGWDDTVANIREEHKRLSALLEELNQIGL